MKISKKEFDDHCRNNNFREPGPQIGQQAEYAPYPPYRFLKGVLRDGTEVESSTDPDWMAPTELDMILDLTDALRQLHDFQNGCPLPKYEKQWNQAMKKGITVLHISEPYLKSKGINIE